MLKEMWAPRSSQVEELRRRLEAHKSTIDTVFLVDIMDAIVSQQEKDLLEKLRPPDGSLILEETQCLEGTREP